MKKNLFRKPSIELENSSRKINYKKPEIPDHMWINCPKCKKVIMCNELKENNNICHHCNYYFKMTARDRIKDVCDNGTFNEMFCEIVTENIINFSGYNKKIKIAMAKSGEKEAVICGTASINGNKTCIFVMEPNFMMGSMGRAVGEKITRIFEYATKNSLPVIGFTVSGGARMQEGIFSLMQMAKVSASVKRHSDNKNLYVAVLTDPTTGGVTASFAMQADIIVSEPNALIGFAGPRVIEQTVKQKLPSGFQRAEFLLEKGFLDQIIPRNKMKTFLHYILKMHTRSE